MAIKIFTVRMLLGRSKKKERHPDATRSKKRWVLEAGIDLKKMENKNVALAALADF